MVKLYEVSPQYHGSIMCSIDVETTGLNERFHEIVQIAVVPLDYNLQPHRGLEPFYRLVRPLHPERAEPEAMKVNGLDMTKLKRSTHPDRIRDDFQSWWDRLDLPFNRQVIPLTHNAGYDTAFLKVFFGAEHYSKLFHFLDRDSLHTAIDINEKCHRRGKPKMFERLGLTWLAEHFEIPNKRPHDALNDSLVGAEVYGRLLDIDVL